jgi:hypothetical protein
MGTVSGGSYFVQERDTRELVRTSNDEEAEALALVRRSRSIGSWFRQSEERCLLCPGNFGGILLRS